MGNAALQLKWAVENVSWVLEHADIEASSHVFYVGGDERIMTERLYSSLKDKRFFIYNLSVSRQCALVNV